MNLDFIALGWFSMIPLTWWFVAGTLGFLLAVVLSYKMARAVPESIDTRDDEQKTVSVIEIREDIEMVVESPVVEEIQMIEMRPHESANQKPKKETRRRKKTANTAVEQPE
jgi:hypothetical protein